MGNSTKTRCDSFGVILELNAYVCTRSDYYVHVICIVNLCRSGVRVWQAEPGVESVSFGLSMAVQTGGSVNLELNESVWELSESRNDLRNGMVSIER